MRRRFRAGPVEDGLEELPGRGDPLWNQARGHDRGPLERQDLGQGRGVDEQRAVELVGAREGALSPTPVSVTTWTDARNCVTTAARSRIGEIAARQLTTSVGTIMPLAEARTAHEMLEGLRPHPRGKIVLSGGE
jgi:hypothetical protein